MISNRDILIKSTLNEMYKKYKYDKFTREDLKKDIFGPEVYLKYVISQKYYAVSCVGIISFLLKKSLISQLKYPKEITTYMINKYKVTNDYIDKLQKEILFHKISN